MIFLDKSYSEYVILDDPKYPGGKAFNASNRDSIDGTPYYADWMNDFNGFSQALIIAAFGSMDAISKEPDTAKKSDRLDALIKIIQEISALQIQRYLAMFSYTEYDAVVRDIGNIDIQTGGLLEIDGKQLIEDDIVFVTRQNDKKENGLWYAKPGEWERLTGYGPDDGEAFNYKYIKVLSGGDAGRLFTIAQKKYIIGEMEIDFFETAFSPAKIPGKIIIRDREGNFECEGSGGGNSKKSYFLATESGKFISVERSGVLTTE
jgi:hypothetical protein